jgi:phosphomevalonate kinase
MKTKTPQSLAGPRLYQMSFNQSITRAAKGFTIGWLNQLFETIFNFVWRMFFSLAMQRCIKNFDPANYFDNIFLLLFPWLAVGSWQLAVGSQLISDSLRKF